MAGAKVSFILGGQGKKPDVNFKSVSPGRFTKASRKLKVWRGSAIMPEGH